MQITKITLENWGPFFGTADIDITTGKGAPVIVVSGKNGHGKTKFIDALKWVFDGTNKGSVKVGPYINLTAIEGDSVFDTAVTVEFEQSKTNYILSKRLTNLDPKLLRHKTTAETVEFLSDIPDKSKVHLRSVGEPEYSLTQTRAVLQRLFPARLVDFYFFDAAQLLENFGVVQNAGDSLAAGYSMRRSVETAMGLKSFDVVTNLMTKMKDKFESQALQENKDQVLANRYKKELLDLQADILAVSKAREETLATLDAQLELKRKLELDLAGSQDHLELQTRRKQIDVEISALLARKEEAKKKLSALGKSLWMAPMAVYLDSLSLKISEGRSAREKVVLDQSALRQQIVFLEKQSDGSSCLACGQTLVDSNHRSFADDIGALKVELAVLEGEARNQNHAAEMALQTLLDGNIWSELIRHRYSNELQETLTLVPSLASQISQLTEMKESVLTELGDESGVDLVAINSRLIQCDREITTLRATSQNLIAEGRGLSEEIKKLRNRMAKLGDPNSRASKRSATMGRLLSSLEKSKLSLQDSIRGSIEVEANLIFKDMRGEADEKFAIEVTPDYSLKTNKPLPNAAFKQQVFLSFLFAIPRVARAPFPVVIDSPLQHLDSDNRERFLSWCANGLRQLILLPHDKELGESESKEIFGESLARLYRLEHSPVTSISTFKLLA